MRNFNKNELIKNLITLLIIIAIAAILIRYMTSGETLLEYQANL